MEEKRHLNKYEYFLLYFKTAPYLLGEIITAGGIIGIGIFVSSGDFRALFSIVLLAIGYFFIKRKLDTLKIGIQVIKYGDKANAKLTNITNTKLEHNERVVKDYRFRYLANNKSLEYSYQSAYHKHLKVGDELLIFYLPDNPTIALIPELYSIKKY